MELTIEDFQQLLFELYMAQRENNQLRAELAKLRSAGVHSHPGHEQDHGAASPAVADA